MADLKDIYNDFAVVNLTAPTNIVTSDSYSSYIDTQGYNGMKLILSVKAGTCDSTNKMIGKLYGLADGGTPTTASSYTACTDDEVHGSDDSTYAYFDAVESTNAFIDDLVLKQHLYRYYYVKYDLTGTFDGYAALVCELSGRSQPAHDDSPTTGTPS